MASVPRSETAAGRRSALKRGLAIPPASKGGNPGFPITDANHWDKARRAIGRVKNPQRRAQVAKLLRKTAPQFGKTAALKQSWAAPGGASMANPDLGIYLAVTTKDEQGLTLTCPECNYSGPANTFGASGASLNKSPETLRTPAPSTGSVRNGAATTVRSGNAAHALAGSTRSAVELAAGTLTARRHPISGPMDVLVARGQDGTAVLRHRHGGTQIASLRKTDGGQWVATVNGKDLHPRDHQRTALMEAVGTWNKAIGSAIRPASAPLQPPPQQTELMAEYGIPAIRALATPTTSAGSGPRMTAAGGSGGGLGPKGQAAYRKLRGKGLAENRAMALAKRVDSMAGRAA